jgi:hypothetical protein
MDPGSDGTGGSGGTGGSPGTGGSGGGNDSEGGQAGEVGEGGQAGHPGDVPIDGGSPDVSVPSDSPSLNPGGYACRVVEDEDERPTRVCARAGRGFDGAPCTASADCGAGLACIVVRNTTTGSEGSVDAGVCRRYCCLGAERSCGSDDYCGTGTLLGVDGPGLQVPICRKADNCSLSSPYPCTEGDECQCEPDKACLVVRADGTTTCADPGPGLVGDECPCAWGHVCSRATDSCLRLCELPAAANACPGGVCQKAADLPENWGVCIETGGE